MSIQLYSSPMKYKDPTTGNYVDIIGISGNPGRGIASVVLNNDYTLTINFTDNTSITTGAIRGATGVGISSIAKTGTSANVDTYTITYTDNNTTTFSITNGITPSLSIGTVVEGAEAAATITGTSENPILNLVLPAATVSGKADKVSDATTGNFAALDANGNLTDSGHKHSDYLTEHQTIPVTDVQVNNTSILNNGIANIPLGTDSQPGVLKLSGAVKASSDNPGGIYINPPSDSAVKAGTNTAFGITINKQHQAVFYGLAKAAGDTTQKDSSNAIGTYTSAAKEKIQTMLNVPSQSVIAVSDTTTATSTHAIGDYFMLNGQLCKAIAAISIGDTVTTSGGSANAEVVKVSDEIKAVEGEIPDIQINGTSIVANEVANIPIASSSDIGVVKIKSDYGINIDNNSLRTWSPNTTIIKAGTNDYRPITPAQQHKSVFYGLATAAGDSTQSSSSNEVGIYTDTAKEKIQFMLNIPSQDAIANKESTTATAAHAIGDYFLMNGKLYKVTTAINIGDTIITNGNDANVEQTNIIEEIPNVPIQDVKIGSTSILNNGVATITVSPSKGFWSNNGVLEINSATNSELKQGNGAYRPITTEQEHTAVFYGLAKAAGDSTQSASNNAIGTYTDNAKDAIQHMLGIDGLIAAHDTATATVAHAIGEIFIMNGKLYRATAAIAINDTITVGTNCEAVKIADAFPRDVQVNGTSAVSNGIANVPIGSWDAYGVYKVSSDVGIYKNGSGILYTVGASSDEIKAATHAYKVITPSNENAAAFYGLAKAAGDSTQTSSSNAVGTYTSGAKAAIQSMIGVENGVSFVETISSTTPTIVAEPNTRYVCGEVSTLAITTPSVGTIDIVFDSGSTATVLTVTPPTGTTMKWPSWFDPTTLDANTSYEILITDGIYGGVMTWAN